MSNENNENQQVPQENEILAQYSNLSIDPSQVPAIFQAFFQNQTGNFDPTSKGTFINTRGSWSQQEDDLLKTAISQIGTKKWSDIARFVPTRTAKQCRERWFNRLDPSLKHGPFEQWEDQIIIEKQKEVGNRWSIIAQLLPGRSCGAIKNRWYSSLKTSLNDNSMGHASASSNFDGLGIMPHDHNNDNQINTDI
ncbi:Myb-like DNA-binding domain containing protein [Histomonas meleagridis]|uniref:Myb-like DNA-binding domain containing protein n=1 Tax=Histomonas meleagridis TaxID=135588 RepID=UPI0035598B64|nr:Myb-like DNA-binding domain containing protein [Histomonas meleagridis]KAH0804267.1 Myb-like DNA-binding domain containing protein [Histomonas meleagridis]